MEILDIIIDALLDTLKIMPILLIVYFLIEFLEYKEAFKLKNTKILQSKASPIIGASIGCAPQCGFSVISTELYAKRNISIGALIAVYISTSDEAIPIMLSNPDSILSLLALILSKVTFAIFIGYISMLIYPRIFKKPEYIDDIVVENHNGCCNHDIETPKFDFLHPILHFLKISGFILLINLIFGFIIYLIGEDNLIKFLNSSRIFQPLLASLIGLIPNCASSVVITELYLLGGLSFGSIFAGLCVNAGLAFVLLFKENKNKKENIFILLMIFIPSIIMGYILHYII